MGEVSVNMDFWDLILSATLLVQLIMALLLAASILSWVIILQRRVVLRRAERDLADFEQAFKQRDSLESLFVALTRNKNRSSCRDGLGVRGWNARISPPGGTRKIRPPAGWWKWAAARCAWRR